MEYIDLHTHSTASDGTDSPAALVEKASMAGISVLALTDHDTLAGLGEAEEAARDFNIDFVRGCEISTAENEREVHILGLWVPSRSEVLDNFLINLRERRNNRNMEMVAKLRGLGFDISMDELRARVKGSIGRPHMATLLLEKGYITDRNEAFEKYIGSQGSAYVPKNVPAPAEAAQILSGLGATVALAHPLARPRPEGWLNSILGKLIPSGLMALEAWHSAQTPEQCREISDLAKSCSLGICGGSDYHGLSKPDVALGVTGGQKRVPRHVYEQLVVDRKKRGLPC